MERSIHATTPNTVVSGMRQGPVRYMKTTVQAPSAPANLSVVVNALNLFLFGPDLEKANDIRIPAFDDIGKALELVNLFSHCITHALTTVCGANKLGGGSYFDYSDMSDSSGPFMALNAAEIQETIYYLLSMVIKSQHDTDVPLDKMVDGHACAACFANIYNMILSIPEPENAWSRAYVDGENYFNDSRQLQDTFPALMSRVEALTRSQDMVIFVKHTGGRFQANAVNAAGHSLLVACDVFPFCRSEHGKLINREIDDVLMLTTAMFENQYYGRATATVVSNDKYRWHTMGGINLVPFFTQSGSGKAANWYGIVGLAAVTVLMAIVGA